MLLCLFDIYVNVLCTVHSYRLIVLYVLVHTYLKYTYIEFFSLFLIYISITCSVLWNGIIIIYTNMCVESRYDNNTNIKSHWNLIKLKHIMRHEI